MVLLGSRLATAVTTSRTSIILVLLLYAAVSCTAASSDRAEGRYSFSLTTFDPQGKLGQVERALEAASLGTPVVCVVVDESSLKKKSSIILAAPQVLPSSLMEDDGTSRFVRVTNEIVVSHSGLSADGRVLVAAAQRLAMEHAYTFDEENGIPIDFFLQELSLLFQRYTMKPGARPFGCFLIVAYMPIHVKRFFDDEDESYKPMICRIDPSGCIEKLDSPVVIINGNYLESLTDIRSKLQELVVSSRNGASNDGDGPTQIANLLRSAIREQAKKRRIVAGDTISTAPSSSEDETILTACLSSTGQFCIERK